MQPIRFAVIGAGVQGQRHAQKVVALPGSELVSIVDIDAGRARALAEEFDVESTAEFRELVDRIDAAVLSTPASSHFEIGSELLTNGVHLLIEKPITTDVDDARELVRLADENSVVLQVGHLERFNPVVASLAGHVGKPEFIESIRIAPYQPRCLDVSVVLDLMIHDIDLIHSFVQAPMVAVDAVGRPVFSGEIDIANARIRFENDCVANVTSSRISMKSERTLRIIQANSYISGDLQNKTLTRYSNENGGTVEGPEDISVDMQAYGDSDAMMDQMQAFIESINGGPPPLVSGLSAMQALETADAVTSAIGGRLPS